MHYIFLSLRSGTDVLDDKDLIPQRHNSNVDRLFKGFQDSATQVWMSHGDRLSQLPSEFCTIATTHNSPYASIAHKSKPIFGIQFHPEVTHTLRGTEILKNFAVGICGAKQTWNMSNFIDQEITRIRKLVGQKGQVIGAVSGGVDSTVAAKLSKSSVLFLILREFMKEEAGYALYAEGSHSSNHKKKCL
jgi:GMP synthase (glutamine-hydrolysing)